MGRRVLATPEVLQELLQVLPKCSLVEEDWWRSVGTVDIAGSRNGEGLGTYLGIFLPCDFTRGAHTSGLFYSTRELKPEKRDSVSSSPVPVPKFHNPCSH